MRLLLQAVFLALGSLTFLSKSDPRFRGDKDLEERRGRARFVAARHPIGRRAGAVGTLFEVAEQAGAVARGAVGAAVAGPAPPCREADIAGSQRNFCS